MPGGGFEATQQVQGGELPGRVKHESSSCITCVFLVCSPIATRGSWAPWDRIFACIPGMNKETPMDLILERPVIALQPGQVVTLDDAKGVRIRATEGPVWVTYEAGGKDFI